VSQTVNIVKEVRVIRLCESNHIANVVDVCVNNGKSYLVTEGSNMGTLDKYLEYRKFNGGISQEEVEHISRDIINAIRYLRIEKGVVITDLRLGDFIVTTNQETQYPTVKLARCRGCMNLRESEHSGGGRKDLHALGNVLKEICSCCKDKQNVNYNIYNQPSVLNGIVQSQIKEIQKIVEVLSRPVGMDWNDFLKIPYIGLITEEDYRKEEQKKLMEQQYLCNQFKYGGNTNNFYNQMNSFDYNPNYNFQTIDNYYAVQ